MKKILIVEDDELLNRTLGYNLMSDGYEIVSVLNKKAAKSKISMDVYDLVLLDVNLPDGNGYEMGAVDYITKMELKMLNLFRKNPKQVLTRQMVLTVLVSLFSFINLLNTSITNAITRKHDYALLEATGM
ncbi:MAG: response regulator transcription factor [Ruminococcus sp.]